MSLKLKLAYELDCPPEEAAIVTAVCTLKRQLWECRHLAAHGHSDLFSSGEPVVGTGTGSPGLQSSSNNEGEGKISPSAHGATEGEPLSGSAPEEPSTSPAL